MSIEFRLDSMKRLLDSKENFDFYSADETGEFPTLLNHLDPEGFSDLEAKVRKISALAIRLDPIVEQLDIKKKYPRIRQRDGANNRIDKIILHRNHKMARKEVVESGIFTYESQLELFANVYLLSHLSEAGIICPIACTVGLVRVLQAVGSDSRRKEYLAKLVSTDTPLAGGQFITEKDAGSDIGNIKTEARLEDGIWKIDGNKYFCSAVDEYFLVAARPKGAPSGTEGVAIFLVPRTLDGHLNNLTIKKLKNKSGTLLLPTAEIDFDGAIAYAIGPIENGFKNLMNYVINTSRLMNAAAALGTMSRAYLEARNYANQRSAFEHNITDYYNVRRKLDYMQATLNAQRTLYFSLISQLDNDPASDFDSDKGLWQRFLINLCKYRTASAAEYSTRKARDIFGGNGSDREFSIIPRLCEDATIFKIWEGMEDVLTKQICGDTLRFGDKSKDQSLFCDYIGSEIEQKVAYLKDKGFVDAVRLLEVGWNRTKEDFKNLNDEKWVDRNALDFVDRLGALLEAAYYGVFVAQYFGLNSPQARLLETYQDNVLRK